VARRKSAWGFGLLLICLSVAASSLVAAPPEAKTRNVVFVMTDGLRWQEVFRGAEGALIDQYVKDRNDAQELKLEFWKETPEARRQALMPFLWSAVAKNGQIYGNRSAGSDAYVTNGLNFSYPGYNEILCGFPDPRIDSNDKVPNPNVTVLEWLNHKKPYQDKVAAFGAWDAFTAIINQKRAGFPVIAGFDPMTLPPVTPTVELLNRLKRETKIWNGEPLDAFAFHTAVLYLKQYKPRVLFLSLGETDEWAHSGQYAEYLRAANRVDQYLKELWGLLQSMPEYRDKTTLIVSTDHGRGSNETQWKDHGRDVPDSKYIWAAFLGPDTPPFGERSKIAPVTQSQIAATLAALLGEDYPAEVPRAGKPITAVLPK
jgi:hypothetical protein